VNNHRSQILKQVRFIDPVANLDRVVDVWLAEGKIQAIDPQLDIPSVETIEARNLILAPGAIDLYSHSGEPGFEERENLASLLAAAVAGGFTRLNLLPDTNPTVDNLKTLGWLKEKSLAARTDCRVDFWGGLTQDLAGERMTELAELAQGAVGFSDGRAIADLGLLYRLLDYAKPLGKPVALVACDRQLRGNGVMREGEQSITFGLSGDMSISETAALAAILEVVAAVGTPVHFMRISTSRGVESIEEAKRRGLPVTASTTWMHLLFDTRDLKDYDPNLRLQPPLGNEKDKLALIEGVKRGIIDAVAIDHNAHTYEDKMVAFADAPAGVIGLELALPLLYQRFVATGRWSAIELWKALSSNAAMCLGQKPIGCNVGDRAELILFDPRMPWRVDRSTLKSLSDNTPWFDREIVGKTIELSLIGRS
jgi:dihydroorotase